MAIRRRSMRDVTVIAVFLMVAGTTLPGVAGSGASPVAAPAVELTLADADGQLIPLDPSTLADALDGQPIDLGVGDAAWEVARSGDGSTLAVVTSPKTFGLTAEDVTIVIRDGRTGVERLRFHPPIPVTTPYLSDDGTRLVVERTLDDRFIDGGPFGWLVFDTQNGGVLANIESSDAWAEAVIDRKAERLYYFAQPALRLPPKDEVPPAVLVVDDLTTGTEAARVILDNVPSGQAYDEDAANPLVAGRFFEPGLAVSPDGRHIVVAPADRDGILLLDAETLAIQRTVALTRPVSAVDRLLDYLNLLPRNVDAKYYQEGIERRVLYSPDGRHVILFGSHRAVEPDTERQWSSGLGLKVVDLATGQLIAEGLAGELIHSVSFTPDGTQFYTAGPAGGRELVAWISEPGGYVRSYVIRRLDATNLDTLAERALATYPRLFVTPSGSIAG
jgi:DNA-binding beta-propeller fold protein YncE